MDPSSGLIQGWVWLEHLNSGETDLDCQEGRYRRPEQQGATGFGYFEALRKERPAAERLGSPQGGWLIWGRAGKGGGSRFGWRAGKVVALATSKPGKWNHWGVTVEGPGLTNVLLVLQEITFAHSLSSWTSNVHGLDHLSGK